MAFNRANASHSSNVNTSEHARALLLPQEVKEIGIDSALIFLENVRPIRCKKIRYYADRRFKQRVLPPPARPAGRRNETIERNAATPDAELPPLGDGLEPQGAIAMTHEASFADVERLDSLTLDDFGDQLKSLKFEHSGDRPTESEFEADVQRFLEAVR
jgi:type IV secretion system protein VirD4